MKTSALRNGVFPTEDFELLTENVRQILASGHFPTTDEDKWNDFLDVTCGGDRFLGSIAYPTIDIELEAFTGDGNEPYMANDKDNEISLSYCVCTKGKMHTGYVEWLFDDYLSAEVKVDFTDPNWKSLLEADMLDKLDKYVEANGYSYTELNF